MHQADFVSLLILSTASPLLYVVCVYHYSCWKELQCRFRDIVDIISSALLAKCFICLVIIVPRLYALHQVRGRDPLGAGGFLQHVQLTRHLVVTVTGV